MTTALPTDENRPTALIAEDEPMLARSLGRLLGEVWPALKIVATVGDGVTATDQALALAPDVLFLDIQMPGRTGLDVAEAVADDWPDDRPTPLLVFATAYDQFAVQAFERAATDYLLKPVTAERLGRAVQRLQERLATRAAAPAQDERATLMQQVQTIGVTPVPAGERIKVIRAGVGNTVKMIPVAEVVCFEAADKYVNVVTAQGEALVRMSLRELAARIDMSDFLQVHRSVLVNSQHVLSATRDEAGHYSLALRGLARPLKVSRAFAHLFRPM